LPDLAEAMLTFQKGHRIEGGDTHIEQEKVVVHHATGLAQPPNIARQGHRMPAPLKKLDQPARQILDVLNEQYPHGHSRRGRSRPPCI
jgi:hypothetical protein